MHSSPSLQLKVGDITIAYRVHGQGEPLILIMGLTGTQDLWDPTLLETLASRYLVITFDNRGMGGTSASGPYAFSWLADDAAGFIAALGLQRAHVLGWSAGGDIGLDLAIRHPERVNRLILYAADCGGEKAINPPPQVLQQLTDTSGSAEERGERMLRLLVPADWLSANAPYVARVFIRPMETATPEAIALQAQAAAAWDGQGDHLGEVRAPTMIVQGMADTITPPENAAILAAGIPGSWLIRFADAGHGLMFQRPRTLGRLVHEFLRDD